MDRIKNILSNLEGRHLVMIGLGALAFVCIIVAGALLITREKSASPQALFSTEVPTQIVISTPTMVATPTVQPVQSNIWVVTKTEVDKVHLNGYEYIVDEFANEANPALTMRAHCMAPKEPAPKVGDRYVLNPWNVLVPCGNQTSCTTGDINSKDQRFMPMH